MKNVLSKSLSMYNCLETDFAEIHIYIYIYIQNYQCMNSVSSNRPTYLHQMTFSSEVFMNFTSDATLYLGICQHFKRKKWQDKLSLVAFS